MHSYLIRWAEFVSIFIYIIIVGGNTWNVIPSVGTSSQRTGHGKVGPTCSKHGVGHIIGRRAPPRYQSHWCAYPEWNHGAGWAMGLRWTWRGELWLLALIDCLFIFCCLLFFVSILWLLKTLLDWTQNTYKFLLTSSPICIMLGASQEPFTFFYNLKVGILLW